MNLLKNTKNRKKEKGKSSWLCILCGSKKKELVYNEKRLPDKKITSKEALCTGEIGARGKHAKIWRCLGCNLLFQDLSFSGVELNQAYEKGEDERYFEQFDQRKKLFKEALGRIEKYKKPLGKPALTRRGKLLDVGSGAGLFVSIAKESGWKAEGLDPSTWASREAKKSFGVKVKKGTFENFRAKSSSFDVICMFDVLEHYLDPTYALRKAHRLLKKGGFCVITTINISSWFSKLLGPHWPWLIRIHLWYFTPKTAKMMIEKSGFEMIHSGDQVRWFSLPYLLNRFTGWNFSWLPKVSLPAPTGDIVFIIARKK